MGTSGSPTRPQAVVVGASAGGLQALSRFVAALPAPLGATVLVVMHLPASSPSRLAEILSRVSVLPVARATSGSPLTPGQVVVAPPDHHLLVRADRVLLSTGAKENGYRPAVDALFRSAARWLGPRAVAVVLSGRLEDGAAGAAAVAARGGTVLVQDPQDALHASMPRRAQAAVPDALSLPVVEIAQRLPALLDQRGARMRTEPGSAPLPAGDLRTTAATALPEDRALGRPGGWYCPRCHGVTRQPQLGAPRDCVRHADHVGGPRALHEAQPPTSDSSLWTAIASLDERAAAHQARAATAGPDRDLQLAKADDVTQVALALRRHVRHDRRAG